MKRSYYTIRMILLLGLIAFLMGFSIQRNDQRFVQDLSVTFIKNDQPFMALEAVNKLLIQNKDSLLTTPKETLVLKEMEARLVLHPMVRKAQVYVTIDGVLGAKIEQRKPIARVSGAESFYIDEDGIPMPLSPLYAARVPLVNGDALLYVGQVHELILTLNQDAFIGPRLVSITVGRDGQMVLGLRDTDFAIVLGPVVRVQEKLKNFKAFYQKLAQTEELKGYKNIDLRYNNQVVATK
ncbi:MAG: cell division protein FtsQ/DivIB [Flavobacteriaceae bacterium]